ncbi:restriction endonuclease [Bacillales bacterium AN1005]
MMILIISFVLVCLLIYAISNLGVASFLAKSDIITTFVNNMENGNRINYKVGLNNLKLLKKELERNSKKTYSVMTIKQAVTFAINNYISNIGIVNYNQEVDLANIDLMKGIEFEYFLKEMFERKGYQVIITKASGDQGVDLILKDGLRTIAIQAKRYKSTISNGAIQEVAAGKIFYDCDEAFVITSSHFTKSAVSLAIKIGVGLLDRNDLKKLINNVDYKI